MQLKWYVVHTYSGFEGRVKTSIQERAKHQGMSERVPRVLVPTEEVIEIKEGNAPILGLNACACTGWKVFNIGNRDEM